VKVAAPLVQVSSLRSSNNRFVQGVWFGGLKSSSKPNVPRNKEQIK